MFVGIFSARALTERREAVRSAWSVPPRITAKFVLCGPAPDGRFAGAQEALAQALVKESGAYADMMFVSCEEGYGHGLLTKKLLAFLTEVHERYNETRFTYKVDDDTIVNLDSVMEHANSAGDYAYGGLWQTRDVVRPSRNPASYWYEPYEVFNESVYPPTALGGPGYVLSRPLVGHLLQSGIAARTLLWNEDRAVSVWVDRASKGGLNISRVTFQGTNGWSADDKCMATQNARRGNFSLTVMHYVTPREMLCFGSAWRADRLLGECFCQRKS